MTLPLLIDAELILGSIMATTTSAPPRYSKPPRLPWSSMFTQLYPPKPAYTEKDVPDLSGKVRKSRMGIVAV